MQQAFRMFPVCPAPEHRFSNTGSGILRVSSSPLCNLVPEYTKDQWLISHEALLFPRDVGLDNNQPGRPGVGLLEEESEAHAATDRRVSLSDLMIRATLLKRKQPCCSVRTLTITGLPILVSRS